MASKGDEKYRMIRPAALFALLIFSALPVTAGGTEHVVEVRGRRVSVKVTEGYEETYLIRAECVIPRSQYAVWDVLSDYDNLENIIPAVRNSDIVRNDDEGKILHQEGRAGFWFFKRSFSVTFRVDEVPKSYIGFKAFEGDFSRFEGSWQIAQREEGTWVIHKVEIEPDFFVPKWALRQMARKLMFETIESVIDHCLTMDGLTGIRSDRTPQKESSPRDTLVVDGPDG